MFVLSKKKKENDTLVVFNNKPVPGQRTVLISLIPLIALQFGTN